MRRLSATVCVLVVSTLLSLVTLSVLTPSPAHADTGIGDTAVPLAQVPTHLAPDPGGDRVWLFFRTGAPLVVDVSTGAARPVEALRDLTGFAVSPDGSHAYGAVGGRVVEVDTATWGSRVVLAECATSLAAGATRVVVQGNGCPPVLLDPLTGATESIDLPGSLVPLPGQDRYLVDGPDRVSVHEAATGRELGSFPWSNPVSVVASSDGRHVLFPTEDATLVRDSSTLAPEGSVVSLSQGRQQSRDLHDGRLLISRSPDTGLDVRDLESSDLLAVLQVANPTADDISRLTHVRGSLVVVTQGWAGSPNLVIERDPASYSSADLTLDVGRPSDLFSPTRVTGTLTGPAGPLPGETIELVREDGTPWASAVTDAGGRYEVLAPLLWGHELTARWDGGDEPSAVAVTTYYPYPVATELTVTSPGAVQPGDQVDVRISLTTPGGHPVPDAAVELERWCLTGSPSSRTSLGSTTLTTDADGLATLIEQTPACGLVEYVATHVATWDTQSSNASAVTTASWHVSAIELAAPVPPRVGRPFTVTARLRIDNEAAPGRELLLEARDTYGRVVSTQAVTTDAQGESSASFTPVDAGRLTVTATFSGDDVTLPGTETIHVHPSQVATVLTARTTVDTIRADDRLEVTGTLVDEDGEPLVGAAVTGWGDETITDATGAYRLLVWPGAPSPASVVPVTFPGDAQYLDAGARVVVDVTAVPSSLTLTAAPSSIRPGETVTLAGRLHVDRRTYLTGEVVDILRIDAAGTPRVLTEGLRVEPDGSFSLTHVPADLGTATYVARHDGGGRSLPTSAEARVAVTEPERVSLTISTDKPSYDAGQSAVITVRASSSSVSDASLTATDATGGLRAVTLTPASAGVWRATVPLRFTTTFVASTQATRDHTEASATLTRGARLNLRSSVAGRWRQVGSVALLAPGRRARVVTSTSPVRTGASMRFNVQRWNGTRWKPISVSTAYRTDDTGRARFPFRSAVVGSRWRVLPRFGGDAWNAPTLGPWVYITIRRPS